MPYAMPDSTPVGSANGTAAVNDLPSGTQFTGPLQGESPTSSEQGMGLTTSDNNFYYLTPDGKEGFIQYTWLANQRRNDQSEDQNNSKKKTKKPKEMINTEHDAVHKHVTPNVVKTHKVPVPYPSTGYADDTPQNVTRRTHARRQPIHRMSSLVTKTHVDEPGDPDGGVQSSTRSSIITPITHAPAVRAEGSHVNRHEDYFHGNNENHLMQVNRVHKTNTYSTSDDQMNDAPDRSGAPASQDSGSAFTRNLMQGSSTLQGAQGAINNAQYFYNNPSQFLPSAANTASNIWTGASSGVSNAYNYVTNLTPGQVAALPGQAVQGVENAAVGAYNHYSNIYQQDGIAGVGGAAAGAALDFGVQYLLTDGLGKAAGTVVKGAETAEEAGAAARKAKQAGKAASDDGNVRVSRTDDKPNERGETCGCP